MDRSRWKLSLKEKSEKNKEWSTEGREESMEENT